MPKKLNLLKIAYYATIGILKIQCLSIGGFNSKRRGNFNKGKLEIPNSPMTDMQVNGS